MWPRVEKGAVQFIILFLILAVSLAYFVLKENNGVVEGAKQDAKCQTNQIWNGKKCNVVTYQGDIAIVGLDKPISSRSQLDEIEKTFIKRSLKGLPEKLFKPLTQADGQKIQDIRLNNFKQIGTDYERTWEFIINTDAKNQLDANKATLGGDAIAVLAKHADAENEIWANSLPKINRKAVLKRIIIVDGNVLSSAKGGWRVVNDHSFGWWANDDLNGVRGFIPYDIDSRWALDENWPNLLKNNGKTFQGVKVDYGLLHELTHHHPVGDNYVYNFGQGRGFELAQPGSKTAFFPWNALSFMYNDHMSAPGSPKLTAPSSYFINFNWSKNPKQIRNAQDNPFPTTEVYGRFFYNTLNIKITGLDAAGVTGCNYLREAPPLPDPSLPILVSQSTDLTSVSFANGECKLVLNSNQQVAAFPGGYIGLQKSGMTFPVYLPRNLLETLYWKNNSLIVPFEYTFTLNSTPKLGSALDFYISKINSGTGRVNMGPSSIWAYMDVLPPTSLPADTVIYGSIDQINNQYIIEYRYPNCRIHDNDLPGCNATFGCAYYSCSNQCWTSGTPLNIACPTPTPFTNPCEGKSDGTSCTGGGCPAPLIVPGTRPIPCTRPVFFGFCQNQVCTPPTPTPTPSP